MNPFGVALAGLGIAQATLALVRTDLPPTSRALIAWCALSFFLAALAYFVIGPRIFGKRADGTLPLWRIALLWPYLLTTWLLWKLWALGRPPWHEVAPGVFLGRRVAHGASLPADIASVIDLTAEMPEPRSVRSGRRYRCLPAMDGHVPDAASFAGLVREAAGWSEPVYIHCAQGMGRGALFAAALLLERGLVSNPDEAMGTLRAARRGVTLQKSQRALLERHARR